MSYVAVWLVKAALLELFHHNAPLHLKPLLAEQLTCILGGIFAGSLLAWGVFRLNARFGEHGLMKMLAEKRHPRYLIRRRKIFRVLNSERKP